MLEQFMLVTQGLQLSGQREGLWEQHVHLLSDYSRFKYLVCVSERESERAAPMAFWILPQVTQGLFVPSFPSIDVGDSRMGHVPNITLSLQQQHLWEPVDTCDSLNCSCMPPSRSLSLSRRGLRAGCSPPLPGLCSCFPDAIYVWTASCCSPAQPPPLTLT